MMWHICTQKGSETNKGRQFFFKKSPNAFKLNLRILSDRFKIFICLRLKAYPNIWGENWMGPFLSQLFYVFLKPIHVSPWECLKCIGGRGERYEKDDHPATGTCQQTNFFGSLRSLSNLLPNILCCTQVNSSVRFLWGYLGYYDMLGSIKTLRLV